MQRGEAAALAAMVAALCLPAATAGAAIVPFTEDFSAGPANWRDASGLDTLSWIASGGRDGGAYVSTTYLVPDPVLPMGAVVFRGQDEFDSSNDAFVGNWIADGVQEFHFLLRHDAAAPLNVFARFASPANFPGAAGISFMPVEPNTWTEIVITIAPDSPQIILEGFPFEDTFSNIGNVQIGIMPDAGLIGRTITIDLDKVSITPAPGALMILLAAGVPGLRRRRRPYATAAGA